MPTPWRNIVGLAAATLIGAVSITVAKRSFMYVYDHRWWDDRRIEKEEEEEIRKYIPKLLHTMAQEKDEDLILTRINELMASARRQQSGSKETTSDKK